MQDYFKSLNPFWMVNLKYRGLAYSTHTPLQEWLNRKLAVSASAQGGCKVVVYFLPE